ncbi:chromate efflux transporter [Aliiroseovarius sp. YM-037]|uniref:chromate efflux transporter n=1 Tax=Aliiroseovarius sp. YM-037 TaxID=3341728 RepID=UPI003A7F93BD
MTELSLSDLTRVFARIGVLSFGGPAAQIALMHRELVEERSWLDEEKFLSALSFCMLLPGPEAMQLATYAGWRLKGVLGGLIAGLLFVIPGALVVLALSLGYALFGSVPLVEALFLGVKATVIVIVIEALLRIAKKALQGTAHWILAALSFIGIFFFDLPFPLIVLLAGLFGYFTATGDDTAPPSGLRLPIPTIATWLAIWWAPVVVLWASGATFLTQVGVFFSKLAVVTFGGAYAVLAYMTQEVVEDKGWLSTAQMVDGLGLAETTPGPLILVTEFVGFQAGFGIGGVALAIAAAAVALWVTFVPCFLWIFVGAPFIDWLAHWPRLSSALRAITAAVVGVILNLSVWFGIHVFFTNVTERQFGPLRAPVPELSSVEPTAIGLAIVAAYLILRLHQGLPIVLGLCAAAAAALSMI